MEPTPRNAFPNVLEKVRNDRLYSNIQAIYRHNRASCAKMRLESCITCMIICLGFNYLVHEQCVRRFFSGCHLFIPLFDPAYDTFESLRDRTPFCFDAILAVAAKIRVGNGQPGATFHRCLEEAQGIARSTLFGPIVRKEAVQG